MATQENNTEIKPKVDGDQLTYSVYVKRGNMLINRNSLSEDDPDFLYNYLKRHNIQPEDFGIEHPRVTEFKDKSRGDLIDEIMKLRKELEGREFHGFR